MSVAPTRPPAADDAQSPADVTPRVDALEKVLTLVGERVGDLPLEQARLVARRAHERLELSSSHTVIALAGATGSGKSSLFNALVGLDLSAVGVRRPTTGLPHACVWGPEGAKALLDWLGIPPRLQTARESVLDAEAEQELRGLALLDLPDHDSIEQAHRIEVDRLVQQVDMLVWVLDPQKYADAALHTGYLRSLSRHGDILMMVLNQVDRLTPEETEQCLADLRRRLDEDGLYGVRLLATSAVRGDGLAELRETFTQVVAAQHAAGRRIAADLDGISAELGGLAGPEVREDIDRTAVKRLCTTLGLAAGVPAVGESIERTYRHRARAASSWPVARAVHGLIGLVRGRIAGDAAKDPAAGVVHTDDDSTAELPLRPVEPQAVEQPGELQPAELQPVEPQAVEPLAVDQQPVEPLPVARQPVAPADERQHPVLRAQAETALRDLADTASHGLPTPWPANVRRAALAELDGLPDALETAVDQTELGLSQTPTWWRVFAALQWLAIAIAGVGATWSTIRLTLTVFGVGTQPQPFLGAVPVPVILLTIGLGVGAVLWGVGWMLAASAARRARARAETALNEAVTIVAREKVLAPVRAELRVYAQLRDALATLTGRH